MTRMRRLLLHAVVWLPVAVGAITLPAVAWWNTQQVTSHVTGTVTEDSSLMRDHARVTYDYAGTQRSGAINGVHHEGEEVRIGLDADGDIVKPLTGLRLVVGTAGGAVLAWLAMAPARRRLRQHLAPPPPDS